MRRLVAMSAVFLALSVCARVAPGQAATPSPIPASYLDYSGHDDVLSGGVKMIPVTRRQTPLTMPRTSTFRGP